MAHIDGYADFLVEMTREKLGYDADDSSHDDEVLAKLTAGEKLSKSKHLKGADNMYIDNSGVRLVTVNEDGSVEILFKNQTYMDIPKERVEIKSKEKEIIKAYESFEGEVEYAIGKVNNDRIGSALEDLHEALEKIGE